MTKNIEDSIADIGQQGIGLTSTEAAALLISGGQTKDPELASIMADDTLPTFKKPEVLDHEARAGLREMMGFDFSIRLRPNAIHVLSKEGPKLSTRAKVLEGEMDKDGYVAAESLIERLVDACVRLKTKWDAEVIRLAALEKKR